MSDNINGLINTITLGTSIKGDIQANGDFRMDGTLDGNITLTADVIENGSGITHNHDIDAISDALGGKDRIWLSWGQEYIPEGGW